MSDIHFRRARHGASEATQQRQSGHTAQRRVVNILPLETPAAEGADPSAGIGADSRWRPTLGAWPEANGVRFRVWAPDAKLIEVDIEAPRSMRAPLQKYPDGTWGGLMNGLAAGARYQYRIDGADAFPDPASRFQPLGVHGPSEVVDPWRFEWTDEDWRGVPRADLALYELHVGTFTPSGTFLGAIERLPYLAQLGVTAIELMPVGDFHGRRNWGYDGVDLFAPARCYGTPDDLRRLVNEAHRHGLAVFMDVVYNHLGPEGNYLSKFSSHYFSEHESPWGRALNFDGAQSAMVRQFFIENALHWVHEYHVDGLRLDATHAIRNAGPRQFVTDLAARVHESAVRPVYVIAEDCRNLAYMVRPEGEGGCGLDGVWADDFHHKVRVAFAGDRDGYYSDYTGSTANLARTLNQGWHYTGQFSPHLQENRGTDPTGIPPRRFVFCIQNHDQVGNRAMGERLHHQIELAAYRAASVLLLCAPATPLLFMGQEWGASSPFQYFTDHPPELGRLVTEGRRREFRHFSAFSDAATRERIPDPQAEATFAASRLDWREPEREPHASLLRLYQQLLRLRQDPAIRCGRFKAYAVDDSTLLLRHDSEAGPAMIALVQMRGRAQVRLDACRPLDGLDLARAQVVLTTEDPPFASDPQAPEIARDDGQFHIAFARPSAVLLHAWPVRNAVPR